MILVEEIYQGLVHPTDKIKCKKTHALNILGNVWLWPYFANGWNNYHLCCAPDQTPWHPKPMWAPFYMGGMWVLTAPHEHSKLVTYFSPQALQWDQKSNQLWFSNHKSAQEIHVAICPSNLARIFVSFSQPTSQLVRHFPRVNHSTEAETLGMKNSQNINISPFLDQQHVVQFPWER